MARSRPRKAKVDKARQERRAEHLQHWSRKNVVLRLHDLTAGILRDCPPARRKEPMSMEEIMQWFETDPGAPVILCTRRPEEPEGGDGIRIAVNRHGVERELRARGIDEGHPHWEMAVEVIGPTLRDMTAEILQNAEAQLSRTMPRAGGVEAD